MLHSYHLAERVPTELKYGLHVLLIRHGKSCANCSANGFAVDKAQYLRSPTPPDGRRVKKEDPGKQEDGAKIEEEETERVCVLKSNGLLGSKGKNKPKKEEGDLKPKVEKVATPKKEKVVKAKKETKAAEAVKDVAAKRESSVGPEGERRSKRARKA